MRTRAQNGTAPIQLGRHIRHILTPKHLSQVAKILRRTPIRPLLGNIIQRKRLVVRQRKDLGGRQERCVVDRGVVVERLHRQLVLVGNGRVVDADEAVGRAGDEQVGRGRVEAERGHVVAVDFGVGCFGAGGGADVPGFFDELLSVYIERYARSGFFLPEVY